MFLKFPNSGGGSYEGPNDAGLEHFRGSWESSLAREIIQNALDAKNNDLGDDIPVQVEFSLENHLHENLGFMESLKSSVESCIEFWTGENRKKFTDINQSFDENYYCLRVSDFNTTGLLGNDDDINSRWVSLVKTVGGSDGGEGRGGSFGIGKSAPLVASHFRTVLYSTKTTAGDYAFQGVSRLASHRDSNNEVTRSQGFIGSNGFKAIRESNQIPEFLRRTENGTDIMIVGYRNVETNWSKNLIKAVLYNFWPSIMSGMLEVDVGGQSININTLSDVLNLFDEDDLEEYPNLSYYFKLLNDQNPENFEEDVPVVGRCQLRFLVDKKETLPKKIAFCREQGMLIQEESIRQVAIPYIGLFMCKSKEGNKLLRSMEPPQHNAWEAGRAEGNSGRIALKEIRRWIREKLQEKESEDIQDTVNLTELSELLPEADASDSNDLRGEIEDLTSNPIAEPAFVKSQPRPVPPLAGNSGDDGSEDDGIGGRDGDGTIDPTNPSPTPPPGPGPIPPVGPDDPGRSSRLKPLRSRLLSIGNEFRLVLRSSSAIEGRLKIVEVGANGIELPLNIESVKDKDGNILKLQNSVSVDEFPFGEDPLEIVLSFGVFSRKAIRAYVVYNLEAQ